MRRATRWGLFGAGVAAAGGLVLWPKIAPRVEEPAFEVEDDLEGLEIRRYGASVVAETEVAGGYRESLYEGFRRLASYIFGKNAPAEKIAMTAPVGIEEERGIIVGAAVAATHADERHWTVSFVMPSSKQMASLPRPLDERVHLRQTPPRRAAVLRFAGRASDRVLHRRETELAERLARAGLSPAGAAQLAQYNPPWIPGPFRRNELIVPLSTAAGTGAGDDGPASS